MAYLDLCILLNQKLDQSKYFIISHTGHWVLESCWCRRRDDGTQTCMIMVFLFNPCHSSLIFLSSHGAYFFYILFAMPNETCFYALVSLSYFHPSLFYCSIILISFE